MIQSKIINSKEEGAKVAKRQKEVIKQMARSTRILKYTTHFFKNNNKTIKKNNKSS